MVCYLVVHSFKELLLSLLTLSTVTLLAILVRCDTLNDVGSLRDYILSQGLKSYCFFLVQKRSFWTAFLLFLLSLFPKADAKISGLFLTFQIKSEKVLIYFFELFDSPKVSSGVAALRFHPVNFLFPSRAFRDWECKGKTSFCFRNAFLEIYLKKFFRAFNLIDSSF